MTATDNVALKLAPGARHALIGPNGAGKTTLVNLLTGIVKPTAGQVLLEGEDVTALSAPARVRRGLSRTFQINQLFPDMTPAEQLCLAIGERLNQGAELVWRRGRRYRRSLARSRSCCARFDLLGVMDQPTRELAYGRQRLLEIALALAARPRVLLLDEPAAGVPEGERADILAALAALPAEVTILLIEHDMDLVFRFAERISVLVAGRLLMEGEPAARSPPTSACARSISEPTRMADLLAVEGLAAGYGEARVIAGLDLRSRRRPLARPARTQRNRQDDAAQFADRRHDAPCRAHPLCRRGRHALPPHRRARLGLGWTPQERNIFRSLSVEENLTAVALPGPGRWRGSMRCFPDSRSARATAGGNCRAANSRCWRSAAR